MSGGNCTSLMHTLETKDIQIKNFSNSDECGKNSAVIHCNGTPGLQLLVTLHPNGIYQSDQEYVSVEILELPKLGRYKYYVRNTILTFFLSVVDFNGNDRCRQSFVQYKAGIALNESIPNLLKRSFILSRADELLPGDVLTIRCKLHGICCKSDLRSLGKSSVDTARNHGKARIALELRSIVSSAFYLIYKLYSPFNGDASDIQSLKNMLANCSARDEIRRTYLSSHEMFQIYLILKDKLGKSLNIGERPHVTTAPTILEPNFLFDLQRFYLRISAESEKTTETDQPIEIELLMWMNQVVEKQRNELKENEDNIRYLLDECRFDKSSRKECETAGPFNDDGKGLSGIVGKECFLIHEEEGRERTFEKDELFVLKNVLWMLKNAKEVLQYLSKILFFILSDICGENERINDTDRPFDLKMDLSSERAEISSVNYHKEILRYSLEEHELDSDSIAENKTKWNFDIETMDGIIFTIPFEDGKETLGSKLISISVVFEKMLETPMREKFEKRVKLGDTVCGTFISVLNFLQREDIETETFSELCCIYEFSDKYDIQELKLLCKERMRSFFSPSNINEAEQLACLHSDKHLKELVESFNEQNTHPVTGLKEDEKTPLDENSTPWKAQTKEQESDFEFYH